MTKRLTYKNFYCEIDDTTVMIWEDGQSMELILKIEAKKTIHDKPEWCKSKSKTYQRHTLDIKLVKVGVHIETSINAGIIKAIKQTIDNVDGLYIEAISKLQEMAIELGISDAEIIEAKYPSNQYNTDNSNIGIAKRLSSLVNQ